MKRLFVVLAMLGFTACHSQTLNGRISSRLSNECVENILAAEEFWAQKTGHKRVIYFFVTDDESPPGYREIVFTPHTKKDGLFGYTNYTTRANIVELKKASITLLGNCSLHTAAHEIGHALLLDHSQGQNDLMRDNDDHEGFHLSSDEIKTAKRAIEGFL